MLADAEIERQVTYVTNVVKHFKWTGKGKRRIHQKPNAGEIAACRPWLDAELAAVKPKVLVALGATAAHALLGRGFRLTEERGRPVESDLAPAVVATVHPSSILQGADESRREAYAAFVADLRVAAALLERYALAGLLDERFWYKPTGTTAASKACETSSASGQRLQRGAATLPSSPSWESSTSPRARCSSPSSTGYEPGATA